MATFAHTVETARPVEGRVPLRLKHLLEENRA